MEESQPEMRIGDRERRETQDWLHDAHGEGRLTLDEFGERMAKCTVARTQRELDELTWDLPRPGAPAPQIPGLDLTPVRSLPSVGALPQVGELVGAGERRTPRRRGSGRWIYRAIVTAVGVVVAYNVVVPVVGADDGAAVFNGRQVEVAADDAEVEVAVLFGGYQVIVPDDVSVRTEGGLMFGGVDCDAACENDGGREVVVDVGGGFGGVDIETVSEQRAEAEEDAAEDAREDAEDAAEDAEDAAEDADED